MAIERVDEDRDGRKSGHLWGKILSLVGDTDAPPAMLSRQAGASGYVLQMRLSGLVTE